MYWNLSVIFFMIKLGWWQREDCGGKVPFHSVSSVQSLNCVQLCDPITLAHQAALSITNSQSLLKLMPIELVMLSNHLIPCCAFSSCLQSSPASGSFLMSQFFASLVAKVLELPHQPFQWIFRTDLLKNWSPYSPRDSQESSPTSQFKSINSSALSLLYGPTLTSIHDYWKNHSFD